MGNVKFGLSLGMLIHCLKQVSSGHRRPRRFGFGVPCFRPETPALYPISLLTYQEGHERKVGRPRRL